MIIRKNTKAFKSILEIVESCADRPDRENLVRLYLTKAGHTIHDRIAVEGIQGESALFYEMGYQAVLGNLRSPNHTLHVSDDVPGIYFFHGTSNKAWDETPFEFDEQVAKAFASAPEMPVLRKKEKVEAVALHSTKAKQKPKIEEKKKEEGRKKPFPAPAKPAKNKQPDYKLKRDILFTGLDRIVVREPQLTKKEVLDYYNHIAPFMLRLLADRPLAIALQRANRRELSTDLKALSDNSPEDLPVWLHSPSVRQSNRDRQVLLANDREHLLLYVQLGCVRFESTFSRVKSVDKPDFVVIVLESPDYDISPAVEVADAAAEIFNALRIPSIPVIDGGSGLHLYIPLDQKADYAAARKAAGYLCKLIRLKVSNLVSLEGLDANSAGRVALKYLHTEAGRSLITPYSMTTESNTVATPLHWKEVTVGLSAAQFETRSVLKRMEDGKDLFQATAKKAVDANELVERLEEHYAFLF